ncbi:MAG TPA: deaminase [Chloroflexia bacterium]|nr:deaminase [Chloroflexia bacterium]
MSYIEGVDYRPFDQFISQVDELDRENNRQEWYGAIADIMMHGLRPSAEGFFMAKAMLNSRMTNCPKAGHGTVIVRNRTVVSDGYNGVPRGYPHPAACGRMELPSGASYSACAVPCLHSETNAIYNAARLGARTEGAQLYVTGEPCLGCSEAIVQAGISRVIFASGRPMPEHPGLRLLYGLGIDLTYMYYARVSGEFSYCQIECHLQPALV